MNREEVRRHLTICVMVATLVVITLSYFHHKEVTKYIYPITIEPNPDWVSPPHNIVGEIIVEADKDHRHMISQYDDIYREVSTNYGNHWCLMSAIGYVESRFDPSVYSYSGAVGLMQIMPRTGRIYNVTADELLNPYINILVANRHYNYIERMLAIPNDTNMRDRMCLVLASYNGGIGHVFDAQRLARKHNEDPHVWRNVLRHLSSLRHSEIYEDNEVVKFGSFPAARYTIRYVYDVMRKYDEYIEHTGETALNLYPYALIFDELKPKTL